MSHFNQAAADNAAISTLFERADNTVNAITVRMASAVKQVQTLRSDIEALQARLAAATAYAERSAPVHHHAEWHAYLEGEVAQLKAHLAQVQALFSQDSIAVVAARCERFRYQSILEARAERAVRLRRRKDLTGQDVFAEVMWPRMRSNTLI